MFKNIANGFSIMGKAIQFFLRNPKSIVPILIAWGLYTPLIIYLQFNFAFTSLTLVEAMVFLFLVVFFTSLLTGLASLSLLSLIEQKETTGRMQLIPAFKKAYTRDFFRSVPILFFWAVIQFVILFIELLAKAAKNSGKNSNRSRTVFSMENVVRRSSTDKSRVVDVLKRGIRMGVMLMLPAVAWENMGPFRATRRGLGIYKNRITTMLTGVALSTAVHAIVFLPPGIMIILSDSVTGGFPEFAWFLMFLYIGFAWSFGILIEQLFTAELYLWYHAWEEASDRAAAAGEPQPRFADVKKPSFIHSVSHIALFDYHERKHEEKQGVPNPV